MVNPWGFFKNQRYNQEGLNCNRGWIHQKIKKAKEVKIILKDLKKIKPLIFASLHEDSEVEKAFFLYSFGERKYETHLIKIEKNIFLF